jgi:pimeloyl-ACP methyl ester carboxylesterase
MVLEAGSGPVFVLIPGVQGRWEWMKPTVTALSSQWRVITGSLPARDKSGGKDGFNAYIEYVDRLLEATQVSSAVVCGISFGGLIALRYAATHPTRVRALILVSAPGPRWKPSGYQSKYLQSPMLMAPLFLLGACRRTWRELRVTFPDFGERLAFCLRWVFRLAAAPVSPSQLAYRAGLAVNQAFQDDCPKIKVPTLIVTGEHDLDRVVNPEETMSYLAAIDGAEFRLFERTGHLGIVTAPDRFAQIVSSFSSRLPDRECQTTSAS